jgi:hypothetical protein
MSDSRRESQGESRAAKRRKKEQNKSRPSLGVAESDRSKESGELRFFSPLGEASSTHSSMKPEGIISLLEKREVLDITSEVRAASLMRAIAFPLERSDFYSTHWQRSPVAMTASVEKKSLFAGLFDKCQFNELINRHALDYPLDLLIGKYQPSTGVQSFLPSGGSIKSGSGKKTTKVTPVTELPLESEFISAEGITKALEQGFSLRLNHPQKYDEGLWRFLSALEHEFNTPLTCEVFVSPISVRSLSQGFAPSLSQGDTFIVQLDGAESWTIYDPSAPAANSSASGEHSTRSQTPAPYPPPTDPHFFLTDRACLSTCLAHRFTLEPGDCLYVPQGYVLESSLAPSASSHSASGDQCMHLTVSLNHASNTVKLLNLVLPQALFLLEKQGREQLRSSTKNDSLTAASLASRALPASFFSFMGVENSVEDDLDEGAPESGTKTRTISENLPRQREQFRSLCRKTLLSALDNALEMLDPAADQVTFPPLYLAHFHPPSSHQISKEFLAGRLPVPLTAEEESLSFGSSSSTAQVEAGAGQRIYPFTRLRMLRPGIARAMVEEGMVVVYHCMDNSRQMFGGALNPLEFELDDGPTIEALLHAYPAPVMVMELPHPSEELQDKIGVAEALFKEGILVLALENGERGGGEEGEEGEDDDDDSSPF